MIRVKLKEALTEKEFRDGSGISMKDVAEATGRHPVTLSKIAKNRGYNPSLELIDRLCTYFECDVQTLLIHVPESTPSTSD
jgi:putative transcriptional regulator